MKRRFLRGASLAFVPLALAGSSLSYFSKEIRLQLFGTNQERAIAEIEGRAGSYRIDKTLTGKPIVKVDLSFSEIDADRIRVVGNLPHLQFLSLLETSVSIRPMRVLFRSISKKIAQAVSGLAVTIV